MTTESEPTLAGVFPPATEEQWLALVDKVLKGAPLSKLRSATPGGLPVEPLYTRDGSPGGADEVGVPGAAPFVRGGSSEPHPGGGWEIRAVLPTGDPREANRIALRELERGATELIVRGAPDAADLATVLDGVYLDLAPVHLEPGSRFTDAAALLVQRWADQGVDAGSVRGGFGADPLGLLAATGTAPGGIDAALAEMADLAARTSSGHPQVRAVTVDTTPYVEAGASETQQLAVMLATGAAYLRALAAAGLDADAACSQIEVRLSADADVFTTMATLRAARRVWSAMTAACGASDAAQAPRLHVRTAERMMTRRDPWVNLLRVTAAAFAAGVGGADSVTTAAFDAEWGEPDELGRRMARNTQLLLQEESNVGRVVDPAGGSWYVESLTAQIAEAAWSLFGELEAAGGLPGVLLDGSLAARIAEVRTARLARIATRKDPITGVSEFADLDEAPLVRTAAADPSGSSGGPPDGATLCEPLPRVRWAEPFEQLRDAADAHLAAAGTRPTVFLVNLGPVAVHTARATFAKNFFEAGGIAAVTSERGATTGFDDPAEAVADATAAGAQLVCLCSSDAVYAERAVEFARALRDAGMSAVHLAGNPGDRRDAETEAGVTEFIHLGVDVLDVLTRAHELLGTPAGTTSSDRTVR